MDYFNWNFSYMDMFFVYIALGGVILALYLSFIIFNDLKRMFNDDCQKSEQNTKKYKKLK